MWFRATHGLVAFLIVSTTFSVAPVAGVPQETQDAQLAALWVLYNQTGGATTWIHGAAFHDGLLALSNATYFDETCNSTSPVVAVVGVECNERDGVTGFYLDNAGLVGELPTFDAFFTAFPSYTQYHMAGNALTGPLPLFPVGQQVEVLGFEGNQFTSVPSANTTHTPFPASLLRVDISRNGLLLADDGPFFEALGSAPRPSLRILQLGGNRLPATLPPQLCNLTRLEIFDITNANVSALSPCFIPAVNSSLQLFVVAQNNFTGAPPDDWCYLSNVETFVLSQNRFTGPLPRCYDGLHHLSNFQVWDTGFHDTFPDWVFGHLRLETLLLGLSHFYGPVPDRFDELFLLRIVSLGGGVLLPRFENETFSGPLPMSLFSASSIESVTIVNTWLQGTFPANLTDATSPALYVLDLTNNPSIVGQFPRSLVESVWPRNKTVPLPRYLSLNSGGFYGVLPDFRPAVVSTFKDISPTGFNFAFENFWGWIPESLAGWVNRASWPGLLAGNTHLYFPVQPRFATLMTLGYEGWVMRTDAIVVQPTPQAWAAADAEHHTMSSLPGVPPRPPTTAVVSPPFCSTGGDIATVRGDFGVHTAGFELLLLPESLRRRGYLGNLSDAELLDATIGHGALIHHVPGLRSNVSTTSELNFTTPTVTDPDVFDGMLVLVANGTIRSNKTEVLLLTNGTDLPVTFYSGEPSVYTVTPSVGLRMEGCIALTITGRRFRNAPWPTVVIESRTAYGHPVDHDVILDQAVDLTPTELHVVIPFANNTQPNEAYQWLRPSMKYPLRFYPAGRGYADRVSPLNWSTAISFTQEYAPCGELQQCVAGHADPFQCPRQQCRCSSRGLCQRNATSDAFQCYCGEGFVGDTCQFCHPRHFGPSCQPCDCDWSHTTHCVGRDHGDGRCVCQKLWIGSRCQVSVVGLAVSFSLLFLILVAGMLVWWARKKWALRHQDRDGYNSLNEPSVDELEKPGEA